ncbi:hypothetical protein, partial [Salmonella sp. SAL4434]|uniref:hypothetical protein n=1 Tax=Salmonella sp. SAL4434 TaxID=3159889 RepID=UPI00397A632A
ELLRLRRQLGDKVAGGLQNVADNERAGAGKALASALTRTRWTLMVLAGTTLLCGVGIVVFATHSISRPISHLVEVARVITHGRTRHRASPEA